MVCKPISHLFSNNLFFNLPLAAALAADPPKILHSGCVFTFLGRITRIKSKVWQFHFRHLFGGCLMLFGACQRPVIYRVFVPFSSKTYFLQCDVNCVNTHVFARCCPKNTVNNVVFVTKGKNPRKYRGLGLPGRQKTSVFMFVCSESLKNT